MYNQDKYLEISAQALHHHGREFGLHDAGQWIHNCIINFQNSQKKDFRTDNLIVLFKSDFDELVKAACE